MGEVTMNLPGVGPVPAAATVPAPKALPGAVASRAAAEPSQRPSAEETVARPQVEVRSLAEAAEMINRTLAESQRELRFSVDEGSGRTLVYVMHPETGEVVRQIPSEVVIAMATMLDQGERLSSLGLEVRT